MESDKETFLKEKQLKSTIVRELTNSDPGQFVKAAKVTTVSIAGKTKENLISCPKYNQ